MSSQLAPPKPSPKPTPMMEQWQNLKAQCGSALLFFRLGDFYELFGLDAEIAAPLMGVALTARRHKDAEACALCGIPIAHFENYLNKLLNAGHQVALAEQVEEASPGKKLVRREIVQTFTPGIRYFDCGEDPHYCAVLVGNERNWSVAAADISTGHLVVESNQGMEALIELIRRLPIEDLRCEKSFEFEFPLYQERVQIETLERSLPLALEALDLLHKEDLACSKNAEILALGCLIRVLKEAHPQTRIRLARPQETKSQVWMGSATRRHLQIFEPKEQSLFRWMDRCRTSFGRRLLKHWLSFPTQSKELIQERQRRVSFLKENFGLRKNLQKSLSQMNDLQRHLRRKKTPPLLFQISQSFQAAKKTCSYLSCPEAQKLFPELLSCLRPLEPIIEVLKNRVQWSDQSDRGWIADGQSPPLDELRSLQTNAQRLLSELEDRLRTSLGVANLKIKYHQVFGYVAEVSRLHRDKIPSEAKRLQSLAQAERFKTEELLQLEEKILGLESRLRECERALIEEVYDQIESHRSAIHEFLESLSELDCFLSLAELSHQQAWSRPLLVEEPKRVLNLESAVHPLAQESFVPLSFQLTGPDASPPQQIILLTGPNMSGKSTCLRVAALCALLHQIGSDVPATKAELSIFDRIMCRMGAMDELSTGKSTFFVEMREVASMLNGATEKSLLLFDELGRGTSTYDGMSLAWSITEHLHEIGCLSMVATHYLEMARLEQICERLQNYHLSVIEQDGKLLFTRSLEKGPANQSYGIHVAELAELPKSILQRARQKLEELESPGHLETSHPQTRKPSRTTREKKPAELPLFRSLS